MFLIRTIKKSVKHQNIGGKRFEIEMEVPIKEVFQNAINGNWACYNFFERRPDINSTYTGKLYYGHVDNLGYVVAEDELEDK